MMTSPDNVNGQPPGVPGWVKLAGAIVAAVVLVLVAVMLFAGGEHGPGRHSAPLLVGASRG
jgi:hypothetical protein